jgi:hypothetical protein
MPLYIDRHELADATAADVARMRAIARAAAGRRGNVGERNLNDCWTFLEDLKGRLAGRVQLSE